MDDNLAQKKTDDEAARRLEQYRKLRKDMAAESKEENEKNYQKRVADMDKKEAINMDDGDDFLKGMKTFGID